MSAGSVFESLLEAVKSRIQYFIYEENITGLQIAVAEEYPKIPDFIRQSLGVPEIVGDEENLVAIMSSILYSDNLCDTPTINVRFICFDKKKNDLELCISEFYDDCGSKNNFHDDFSLRDIIDLADTIGFNQCKNAQDYDNVGEKCQKSCYDEYSCTLHCFFKICGNDQKNIYLEWFIPLLESTTVKALNSKHEKRNIIFS